MDLHARKPKSNAPNFGVEIITVTVGSGEEKQQFAVHKTTLIKHSDYFATMFRGGDWKEAKTGEVALEEDDPAAFDLFHKFVYTGGVWTSPSPYDYGGRDRVEERRPSSPSTDSDDSTASSDSTSHISEDVPEESREADIEAKLEWSCLWAAWELGHKLLSTTFRDAVTDAVRAKVCVSRKQPSFEDIAHIYPKTSGHGGLGKLLIDTAVWHGKPGKLRDANPEGLQEFLLEFACASRESLISFSRWSPESRHDGWGDLKPSSPVDSARLCTYHEHGNEATACYSTMF